jgi:RNA polymerase sigma-70 factor, ECF subfamily
VATGDRQAVFERIIRDHQAAVWRYLRFLGSADTEADDLTQETFIAVWNALCKGEFRVFNKAATAGYLRTVARSRFLMHMRAKGRRISETDLVEVDSDWVQAVGEEAEGWDLRLDALDECLKLVNGKSRQVLEKHYMEGLKQVEIARQLGMQPEGVRTALKRVLAKLRDCMESKV